MWRWGECLAGLTAPAVIAAAGWRGLFLVGAALPAAGLGFGRGGTAGVAGDSGPQGGLQSGATQTAATTTGGTLLALLRPPYRERTLRLWLVYALSAMMLYFLMSWLPAFLEAAGWSPPRAARGIALLQFGGIAGSLVQAWLVDRRRAVSALVGGFGMTLATALLFAVPGTAPAWPALLVLMGSGVAGVVMSLIALGAIFYPPEIRATGFGWAGGGDAGRRGAGATGGWLAGCRRPRAPGDARADRRARSIMHCRRSWHATRGSRSADSGPKPIRYDCRCAHASGPRTGWPSAALTLEPMGASSMSLIEDTFTTPDGVRIFYKDWGVGPPLVFSHGWPLSADDWDAQLMFFVNRGFRVIAHDRRGHWPLHPNR